MSVKKRNCEELSIIIPVYNEGENFLSLWSQLKACVKSGFRCYVVYDFEADNTLPVIKQLLDAGERHLHPIKNRFGKGVVNALKSGFAEINKGPLLVVMADLSDDLSKVDEMLALYKRGFDLVAASRYMRGGRLIGGPFFKQTLSRLAGLSLCWFRGLPTHDATNAFKLYDKEMLDEMTLASTGGFEVNLEITVKAFLAGYRIAEVPAIWRDRTRGESRFKIWRWLPKYLRWYFYAFQPRCTKSQKPVVSSLK